jgi:precorrin-6A/cobalt-precorrin-6A reductase
MRILILGGTIEAFALATRLSNDARFAPIYSLAGRTTNPVLPPVAHRAGGFGGVQGLADWLRSENIDAIVDATHPFAARISANAAVAARQLGLPLLFLQRPPWRQEAGDHWTRVGDMAQAAAVLGEQPAKVFLGIGRQEVAAFKAVAQHFYLVRAIEPPDTDSLPPRSEVVLQRGPFKLAAECELLVAHGIDCVVSKNAGGGAAYAKIAAARTLGLRVVMVERAPLPDGGTAVSVDEAMRWLSLHHDSPASERGV